ncbi:MAG: aspartate-semialdehyde dehydrogenase [Candidatus Omnitrophica bacterium]|nr:aspartate-semialdehyde dehydrogenase [Candidatus Omnitrophota bacterium]
MSGHRVSIVGVTGAVGQVMLECLEQRNFPVGELCPLASSRSAGKKVTFKGQELTIQDLEKHEFQKGEIVLSSAGASVTRTFRERAIASGAIIVDNTSAFRMEEGVPLVIPEVNGDKVATHSGLIANPNCCAAILTVALWPLYKLSRIKRLVISTYQSASGAGAAAMADLVSQCGEVLEGKTPAPKAMPHQLAFNVYSHNAAIEANGYNGEENKVVAETRKIFNDPEIGIAITCVRVPVLRAHSEAVNIEFENPVSVEEAREAIRSSPGVRLVDDREKNYFPMPLDASGIDEVLVGRIRSDISRTDGRGLEIFISGDQLRKGAALNAVQIAEQLV